MPLARAKPSPLWWDELPPRPTRPAPAGDLEADIAIVGAGDASDTSTQPPASPARASRPKHHIVSVALARNLPPPNPLHPDTAICRDHSAHLHDVAYSGRVIDARSGSDLQRHAVQGPHSRQPTAHTNFATNR